MHGGFYRVLQLLTTEVWNYKLRRCIFTLLGHFCQSRVWTSHCSKPCKWQTFWHTF